jgi:hypothetical protein
MPVSFLPLDEAKHRRCGIVIVHGSDGWAGGRAGGWAGGNKNEPLVLGSPNSVQRFAPTQSDTIPKMKSLATSVR